MDSLGRDEYAAGIFTFVTYELLEAKILENEGYDDVGLRKAILKSSGQLRDSYTKYLPPFDALPEPVMDVFAEFSCSSSVDKATVKFCYSYFDGTLTASDIPSSSLIADLTYKEAKKASNSICNTVSQYWDGLIANATQFYASKELVVPTVWEEDAGDASSTSTSTSPSPSPSVVASESVSTEEIGFTSVDSTQVTNSWSEHSVNVTSSLVKAPPAMTTSQQSTAVHKPRNVGVALLTLFAVLAALLALFVYLKRKRMDRETTFLPVDCSERYTDGCFIEGEEDDPTNEKELIFI